MLQAENNKQHSSGLCGGVERGRFIEWNRNEGRLTDGPTDIREVQDAIEVLIASQKCEKSVCFINPLLGYCGVTYYDV